MSESSASPESNPDSATTSPRLPDKPGGRRRLWISVSAAVVVVAAIVVGATVALTGDDSDTKTIKIGVVDASEPYWKTFTELADKKLGVDVELVNFGDYSQPNPALREKQLDLNEFQHIQYLANYNVSTDDDLQPIGATAVYPLPLYSLKYSAPDQLPANAKIAISNDAINEARGLLVLQSAKLLTLKDGGTAYSTTKDITTHKVDVVTLDAAQTATALKNDSVAGAIVNNNFATAAKLPRSKAIYSDNPSSASSAPYVNVFVARSADKDDATYRKLVALYHSTSVRAGVQKANGGTAVFRTVPADDLQAELKKVEAQAKAAKQ